MTEQATQSSFSPQGVPSAKVQYWLGEVAAARKRERDWRKQGKRVLEIYEGKKKDSIPFNILYSNTETLSPALYNQTPRPVVQRRFKDEDPLGKAASQAGQRTLEFAVDSNDEEYASFDDVMGDAVLDALLPGRAGTRIKYDAYIVGEAPNRYIKSEVVCFESLKWDRWTHGFAKKWRKVPWVAFEHDVDLDEAKELFGTAIANKMTFTEIASADKDERDDADDDKTTEDRKVAKVWEIWVKKSRTIIFVSPNYQEAYLKEDEDPLELTGFYPMPKPLRFLRKSNNLMPTAMYTLYENQAKELNRLSVRINKVAEAIKVRGAYDSTLDLENLLKSDDNTLSPAEGAAGLQNGGLEKAIWLMPIDKLVLTLQQLYIARENCKKVIYEITGVSDILRGQSVASETATAQQIKNQWGTLRLKRLQRDVAIYARDCLRIALEIAAKKFQAKTFAAMTGLQYLTALDVQTLNGQEAALRAQASTMMPMPNTPPTPEMQQLQAQMQQVKQRLATPSWEKVLEMLRDDTQRAYHIDIESNSTVDVEATEDQKLMGEVLTAIGQFMSSVSPLIISGAMPFQVAQTMLLSIVRRYRFGTEIEDQIKMMQPPAPPDAGKKEEMKAKQAMEREKHDQALKEKNIDIQAKEREAQGKAALEAQKLEFERERLAMERERARMEHEAAVEELRLKKETAILKVTEARELSRIKIEQAKAMPKGKPNGKGDNRASA